MWTPYEDPLGGWKLPLPVALETWLVDAGYIGLPAHLHEIVLFAGLYTVIYLLSQFVSPIVVPQYRELSKRNQVNFDMHVVSQVQAILICALALPLFWIPQLDSLVSYTPYSGFVVAAAAGYFVWDTYVSWKYRDLFGPGFLAHAVAALITFIQGSRPFMHNFVAPFVFFEASTPFVNHHWWATHVPNMFSEQFQVVNGLLLIVAFFLFRIVSGPYHGYYLFTELWTKPPRGIPQWAIIVVSSTYTVLTLLNLLWFSKMIRLAAKRISGKGKAKAE